MPSNAANSSRIDPSDISLRRPSSEDEAFLIRLFRSFRNDIDHAVGLSETERDAVTRQQFDAQRRSYRSRYPNSEHRIITVREENAGRVWVNYNDDEVRLIDIMILPRFQGRGIGQTLLSQLKDEARRLDAPIRHMVHTDNHRAHQFYRKQGFQQTISTHASHHAMVWRPGETGS